MEIIFKENKKKMCCPFFAPQTLKDNKLLGFGVQGNLEREPQKLDKNISKVLWIFSE